MWLGIVPYMVPVLVTFVVSLISAGVGLRFLDECWLFARNRARCSADVLNDSVIISLSRF